MRRKIRNIFLAAAALCLASSGMLMAQSEDAPDEVRERLSPRPRLRRAMYWLTCH